MRTSPSTVASARGARPPGIRARCALRFRGVAVLRLLVVALALAPAAASGRHLARLDPTEPLFTQRAFVEKNLELDTGWEKPPGENDVELAPGVTWVFWKMLELDLEVPVALRIPDDAATVGSVGDLGFAAQVQLCCAPDALLDYLSLRGEVAAPTGSLAKGTGGVGAWSVSVLPARDFTVADALPDLLVQVQLSYEQGIRAQTGDVGDDGAGADDASPGVRQKAFVWNTAFAQQYLDGRFRPVFEVLGTTVLDAAEPDAERSYVELAGGLWLAPFSDDSWLSPLNLGVGIKWPVTRRLESEVTGVLVTEWSFGT